MVIKMKRYKRKRAKRKLQAHDSGSDRHHKGTAFLQKQERLQAERTIPTASIRKKQKSNEHIPITVAESFTGADKVILCQRCCHTLWSVETGFTSKCDLPCW